MAEKTWSFYPHPGGKKRRGLELSQFGWINWAACNTGDARSESIWLPGPADATLETDDPAVATVA